jgi:hypothetical protein
MAQGTILDFRLVSFEEKVQKSLEYGDEGHRDTEKDIRKPNASIVAWLSGSGRDLS